eukprot:3229349-Rhodomonas_salina.2
MTLQLRRGPESKEIFSLQVFPCYRRSQQSGCGRGSPFEAASKVLAAFRPQKKLCRTTSGGAE